MPQLVEIDIDNILVEESLFNLNEVIFSEDILTDTLKSSLESLGVLEPVLLYKYRDKEIHLIDGRKRIEFLRDKGQEKVKALLLPKSTPLNELFSYILYQKKTQILESTINTIQFIKKVSDICGDTDWIIKNICIPLRTKPHKRLFEEIEIITELPYEVRRFFHEKRFSYKQILNLSYYPHEILTTVLSWRGEIYLTASLFEEIVVLLKDILKANRTSIEEFLSDPKIKDIFKADGPQKKRTEALREFLFKKRYPILVETNKNIKQAIDEIGLPKNIDIYWDRTLENKELIVKLKISLPEDLIQNLDILSNQKTLEKILKVLDKL
jgi:hypothetical protein